MMMMVKSIEVDYGIAWLKEVFRYPQNGLNLIGLNIVCSTACLLVYIHMQLYWRTVYRCTHT